VFEWGWGVKLVFFFLMSLNRVHFFGILELYFGKFVHGRREILVQRVLFLCFLWRFRKWCMHHGGLLELFFTVLV
jgi:hypothetical protein